MIWWLVIGVGVLLLSGKAGGGPKALPDPQPSTEWRAEAIEASACEIVQGPTPTVPYAPADIQWLIAKGAYPEHSWPLQPGADLPDGSPPAKVQLWRELGEFAEKVHALEISCPPREEG